MTEKEFKEKYDLEYSDLEYISDMISMGNSFVDISNAMGIEIGDLEDIWADIVTGKQIGRAHV